MGTGAEAYKDFEAAREELLAYSRRLGLVAGDATDRDTRASELAFTVDTAEELLRLDTKVKEAWAIYQRAQEEEQERQ